MLPSCRVKSNFHGFGDFADTRQLYLNIPKLILDDFYDDWIRLLSSPQGGRFSPFKELLAQQKLTNKLLQIIVSGGIGFVLGLVVLQLLIRVRIF